MQFFLHILRQRAQSQPTATAYRFFKGGAVIQELSYASLWQQAASFARHLQAQQLQTQRALLVCKEQSNFVIAFWACLLAGVIAVPTALPRRQNLQGRLNLLIQDGGMRAVIADNDDMLSNTWEYDGQAVSMFDLRSSLQASPTGAEFEPCSVHADSLAFLQYTSGSTGDPKGVMVTHGNLVHNCMVIAKAMQMTPETEHFIPLPLYHDMGLIGGVMLPMYVGCRVNIMSPVECVQYPERWIRIISDYKVTHSGGPNFMFDLAARVKPEQVAGVDLSHWKLAFCGAEPIRPHTVERFQQFYAPYGLRASAFYPCYGMAEATLFITGKSEVGAPAHVFQRDGQDVISCGRAGFEFELAIVDPDSKQEMPAGCTGEIWARGPSVSPGYWGRDELNREMFQAQIKDGDGRGWLRTGDLGFLKQGELVVTSRLKDIIIAYGKKYAPQDLEDEAERNQPALRPLSSAAFSINDGSGDKVVLVCELQRTWLRRQEEWPALQNSIRNAISQAHSLSVNEVVLIQPGTLPRTSSGKVRRSQARQDYLHGALSQAKQAQEACVASE